MSVERSVTSEGLTPRLMARGIDGESQPLFAAVPLGSPSPSPAFVIERHCLGSVDWKTHLLPNLMLNLFFEEAIIGRSVDNRTSRFRFRASTVGCCRGNEWHSIFLEKPISFMSMQIGEDVFREVAVDLVKSGRCEVSVPPLVDDTRVTHLLMALAQEQQHGYPCGTLFVDSVGFALARILLKDHGQQTVNCATQISALQGTKVRRVVEYMRENLDRKLTLRQLAQCAGLSATHFAMQFRAATGYPPHRYLLKLRMDFAKSLLKNSTTSILEVALRCGFHNQQHFATVFRRLHGISPSQYRGL